ncbi:hypothetical protein [Bifidobacterium animalis]|uniref:hypothetical protein n=1 Tax=Bifidobacterium animalis TaxID=28025 RepID=UPI003BAA3589
MERKLEKIEQQKGELESQMNAHDPTDYEGLGKLSAQIAELETQQGELETEWFDLSEQLGK